MAVKRYSCIQISRSSTQGLTAWAWLVVFCALIASGCSGHAPIRTGDAVASPYTTTARLTRSKGEQVVRVAEGLLGIPYRYGGATPAGFDCSGLVYYAYRQAGVRVPRVSTDQLRYSHPVSPEQLSPGDLVFFQLGEPKASHVGIYVGHGRFIHAPSTGKQVSYADLGDPYWQQQLIAAGRF